MRDHPLFGRVPPNVTLLPRPARRGIVWGAEPPRPAPPPTVVLAFVPPGAAPDRAGAEAASPNRHAE